MLICFNPLLRKPQGDMETYLQKIIISYFGKVMSLLLLQESELMETKVNITLQTRTKRRELKTFG